MQSNFWSDRRVLISLALNLLALAEIVDLTIVTVALPHIMGSLGANINEISLTITSYIVAAAIFIPLTGMVTAKYGMKHVAIVSAILFGLSSVLCGIATSVEEMVIFRLVQGVGGAFLPSIAQAYVANEFQGKERNKMMGVFSSCVVLGPIIGPILGGTITEHLTWQWIFYVNVPICLLGIVIVQTLMVNKKTDSLMKTDWLSFIFMALGFGCLEYFLDEGNSENWFDSKSMIIVFVAAILFIGFFIWRGLLGKSVVNFAIFKYRNYILSCFAVWWFMVIMVSTLAFFPTLLQQGYGFPVDTAGFITVPRGLSLLIATPVFLFLGKFFDPRALIVFALGVFVCATLSLMSFSVIHSNLQIILTGMLQGFGMMGVFLNLMQLTFTNMPAEYNNDASGVFNFFRNIGSSVGTSFASTIIATQQQVSWHDLVRNVSAHSVIYQQWLKHIPKNKAIMLAAASVSQQAFIIANLDIFFFAMISIVFLVWVPFFLDKPNSSAATNDASVLH